MLFLARISVLSAACLPPLRGEGMSAELAGAFPQALGTGPTCHGAGAGVFSAPGGLHKVHCLVKAPFVKEGRMGKKPLKIESPDVIAFSAFH